MLSRRLFRPRRAAALFATLCLLAPARAQQQTPAPTPDKDDEEVVRISSELVQTDVMVFDGSGKFVDGLKPEQFELRVDGRPQQVVFFERVKAGTVNEDAQIAAARGGGGAGPAEGGAVLPLDRGRTVLFFVDDLHLSAASAMHIRKTIRRFIDEEIGQNDEAVVVSASGQVGFLSQLTDNRAVLRAAAERINTRPSVVRDGQTPLMTEVQAAAVARRDQMVIDYFVDALRRENPLLSREMAESQVEQRAQSILQQSRAVALNTLYTLASVVKGYGPYPGRKVLFFISDGFLVDDNDSAVRDRMRIVSDAAARAGVVIYSLDAQGLRTGQPDASDPGNFDPGARLAAVNAGEISAMQAPLFTLAADTGGRALVNTNALGRVVSGALRETALYYLLAWRPESTPGGGAPKYQRIEVAVRERPDLRVLVRRGFYSGEPAPEAARVEKKKKGDRKADDAAQGPQPSAAERDLLSALKAPLARAALPTSLAVGYVSGGPTEGGVLNVSVEIEREALTFVEGEQKHADFALLGFVLDDRGRAVRQFGQSLSVTPTPLVPESQQHVVYSFRVALPPGLYQVRAAARDEHSGRTGSAMQWVEMPELKKQFAMSSVFLGERTAGQPAAQLSADDLPRSVLLSVARRFARTSQMRFLTFVYNPAASADGKPDVALQVQVFRDDQPVLTAPLTKLRTDATADLTRLPYMAEMSLASFPPGRYVLQLTAIDRAGKTSTSQRTSFVVE